VKRRHFLTAVGLVAAGLVIQPALASADGSTVFVPSATVSGSTVTLPLRHGRTTAGVAFDYIVIEASSGSAANQFNVNVINKLANVGTAAQSGRLVNGTLEVEAGVDFAPMRRVVGTPGTGFPPRVATPGSRGLAGYSPLVRLPDGSVINAPQVANASGQHDKIISISSDRSRVTLQLTDGFSRKNAVRYLSTESSAEGPAALEGSTFAPRLAQAPRPGDDSTASGRASLAAFVNGPTAASGQPRQGLNSALLGEGDPFNVLAWMPNQGRYSPLWDVHLTEWAPGQTPRRITEFAAVEDLARDGAVTGVGGSGWAANDIIVNCPIIALLG
jgi:hypothetical protein